MRYTEEAWSRSELTKTELEMEISKVRMEAAGLRDALLKMQNVNEGLTQEKADLNKTLMQVVILFLRLLRLHLNFGRRLSPNSTRWICCGFVVHQPYKKPTTSQTSSGVWTTHNAYATRMHSPVSVCMSVCSSHLGVVS